MDVETVCKRPAVTCRPATTLAEATRLIRGCRRLLVLDVHAAMQGVLGFDDPTPVFADQTQRLSLAVRTELHHGSLDTAP